MNGGFRINDLIVLMLTMFIIGSFSSICLPFIFKWGTEKGRIAYYVMIGFVCAGGFIISSLLKEGWKAEIQPNVLLIGLSLVGIGIYALSWYLSIVFYKNRDQVL